MKKNIKDYLHLYLGCECDLTIDDFHFPYPDELNLSVLHDAVYGNRKFIIKPILRHLSDMTEEEAQECLIECFLVPPHNAWMDVEDLKNFLADNINFNIDLGEECETAKPLVGYEATPLTFFLLTKFLISKHFDLFDLIDAGLAIDKTKASIEA